MKPRTEPWQISSPQAIYKDGEWTLICGGPKTRLFKIAMPNLEDAIFELVKATTRGAIEDEAEAWTAAAKLPSLKCENEDRREILVTTFTYGREHSLIMPPKTSADLDCSLFSPCELKPRHFIISTDARGSDEQCVGYFIAALKESGEHVDYFEWTLQGKPIQPSA